MIPNDFIAQLLSRVDVVEVIDRFVPLKKAGQNYQACCPFHKEKSPSFSVSPTKQFYHCFGCGAHGTAIGFLMEHQGLSFPDAIEDLARHCGLTVPQEDNERAFRKPAKGKWDHDVEAAYQFGKTRRTTGVTDLSDLDVEAWFAHAEVGYGFADRLKSRLSVHMDVASGDKRKPGKFKGR